MTTLTFTIPADLWLSANRTIPNHGMRRAKVNGVKALAAGVIAAARVKPIEGRFLVDWTIRYPKGVRTDKGDPTNAHPTTKACLDALVDSGVIPDDGPRYVVAETFRRGPNLTEPHIHTIDLVLTSQEVPWL